MIVERRESKVRERMPAPQVGSEQTRGGREGKERRQYSKFLTDTRCSLDIWTRGIPRFSAARGSSGEESASVRGKAGPFQAVRIPVELEKAIGSTSSKQRLVSPTSEERGFPSNARAEMG